MGLCYRHLLIPPVDARATPEAVGRFFRALLARGAPGCRPQLRVNDQSATLKLKNPSTGEEVLVPKSKWTELRSLDGLAKKIGSLARYQASLHVDAAPGVEWFEVDRTNAPPDAAERIGATVCVFPTPTPTSTDKADALDHRFSHPQTNEERVVPGAGSARFWIEVTFEKFEVPERSLVAGLDIAPGWYLAAAEEAFEVKLAQGAQWS